MSSNLFPRLTEGEEFIIKWQYHLLGHFWTALIEAIALADEANLEKLRMGFPDEVEGYLRYTRIDGWWKDVQERANIITPKKKEG